MHKSAAKSAFISCECFEICGKVTEKFEESAFLVMEMFAEMDIFAAN